MSLVRGLIALVKFALKASLAVGIIAAVGASIYATINQRGGQTSYESFPDVPVNPASEKVS